METIMLATTKRKLLGATMLGAGAMLSRIGVAKAHRLVTKGRILLDGYARKPQGLIEATTFR